MTLIGTVTKLPQEKVQAYREDYLKKHKDAFWVDFGDFSYFSLDSIEHVRYVGGFARAGSVTGAEYLSSSADPLASFADNVISHMNADHADSTLAMIKHYIGVDVSDAKILSLDKYGMTVEANLDFAGGEKAKVTNSSIVLYFLCELDYKSFVLYFLPSSAFHSPVKYSRERP